VTATLAAGRPDAIDGRSTFVALAARELRRFVVIPVLLFAVVMTLWTASTDQAEVVLDVAVSPYPAIFLGGFGMIATYWLTRSMRNSEPVVGVTPISEPVRTAALCVVAIVPLLCGCVSLGGLNRSSQHLIGGGGVRWREGSSGRIGLCVRRCVRRAGRCRHGMWSARSGF